MDEALERKISAAFHGGEVRRRELRLSRREAEYIRGRYGARVRVLQGGWYEVGFGGMEDG